MLREPIGINKTFCEPEGVKAGIVAVRNYYPIVHFNVWLTLAAWVWFDKTQVTASTMVLADGAATFLGLLLEITSRIAVYPWRYMFTSPGHRSLPAWSVLLTLLTYVIGIAELGLWVLNTYTKMLPKDFSNYAFLGALGAGIIVRSLHNIVLFFNFPSLREKGGHHKYRSTSCGSLNRLFWKTSIFIAITAAILVPLYYWFVVPTLQRSAFWVFCGGSSNLVSTIQCYIGIIGLWIPLISVILIMDFIAYAIVLSFYGAYLALANDVGLNSAEEAALSVINGFRIFSALLKRWSLRSAHAHSADSGSEMPSSDKSESSSSAPSSSSKSKKEKKKKKSKQNSSDGDDAQAQDDDSAGKDSPSDGANPSSSSASNKVKSKSPKKLSSNGSDSAKDMRGGASHAVDESEFTAMMNLWFLIVDDLVDMDLISREMAKSLYVALNWQEVKIGSKPKEIIQFFFASLDSFSPTVLDSLPENYLQKIPPLTQLIPSYGESVIFDMAYLCNSDKKPISNMEFLVLKYPKEWEFFYERMKLAFGGPSYVCYGTATAAAARSTSASSQHLLTTYSSGYCFPSSADEMLLWFLQAGGGYTTTTSHNRMAPDLIDEIRLWASLRGQTLYKTIRGTLSYRMALTSIYNATNIGSEAAIKKCQVILAHQQYGDPSMLRQIANDIILVYKRLSCPHIGGRNLYGDTPFDLVFDWAPRDLVAQDTFRKKLSQQQNEEHIRRYALKSIFNETERICSFGETLKRLVDLKSGSCPIDPKSGFPFASILAGLPTATRIRGKTWLFKYKGQASSEFSSSGHASASHEASTIDGDDELSFDSHSARDSTSMSSRRRKKPEVFKWDFLACGDTVLHAPVQSPASHASDDTPGWLRCFHADTGREFDFLLRRNSFDIQRVSFVRIPAKSVTAERSSESTEDLLASDGGGGHQNVSSSSTPLKRFGMDHSSSLGNHRVYAIIKFGIRSTQNFDRPEVFAIATCLNADQLGGILERDSKDYYNAAVIGANGGPGVKADNEEETPLNQADAHFALEIQGLQRALTRSSRSASFSIEPQMLTQQGRDLLESVEAVRELAADFASESALSPSTPPPVAEEMFLGIEVKAVMPRRNPLLMRVAGELPFAEADRIQGKAANQMNGLRFANGLIIQTKDANQGGNVAEAMKFPMVLSKFGVHLARDRRDQVKHIKKWAKANLSKDEQTALITASQSPSTTGAVQNTAPSISSALSGRSMSSTDDMELEVTGFSVVGSSTRVEFVERSVALDDSYERDSDEVMLPPAIIGFRESVFTRGHGAVARFQAYAEWAFGTIVQRVLSKLGLRMHYGHPDFFLASWIYSRSSMSKANPVYNLSEDIFAGYMALLNSRRSVHTDKIQDEKGRDTSLGSTYTFTAKLAQGAASQMKSRDVFWMNTRLDFLRAFLLFHSSLGYYFTTTAMLSSVKMYLFGLLVFSLAGYSAENLGNLQFIYSVPFLVQVGMFTLLPLILEVGVEEGVWSVLKVVIDLPLSLGYFLFQGQTTSHHLVESFSKGKSHYEATGRLLGISRKSLVDSYQLYGRSHLEPAMDYLFYVVVYYIVSSSRFGGYLPLFAPIICVVVFIIAPTGFQLGFSLQAIFTDIGEFGRWVFSTESYSALLKEWRAGPMREQMIKNLTWKATFKTTHSRLQTYSIFNNLKSVLSTHWRVDVAAAVSQLFRVVVWGFIIVSIPGGMKDSVLKVLIGFFLYLMLAMAVAANTSQGPRRSKSCWRSFSNVFFVLSLAYFVALFIILGAWRYLGDCAVGVFLSIKFLKSLSWTVFHLYAFVSKVSTTRRWRNVEKEAASKKISPEDKERVTKRLKSDLEKRIIAGLYLVETVDRPVLMVSISIVLIPIHIVWSLIWAIPLLSHWLMYSIKLVPKVNPEELAQTSHPSQWGIMGMGGFNTFAGPDDFNELPSFDFEGDEDFY